MSTDYQFVENDPLFVSGYIDVRLVGSGISVAGIRKVWENGIFRKTYHWEVRTVFKTGGRRSHVIGGYYATAEEAKENAIRMLGEIFRKSGK